MFKKIFFLFILLIILLYSTSLNAGIRYNKRIRKQHQFQSQVFNIHSIKEGKAEVDVTIKWRRFVFHKRLYTDVDITKEGVRITGVIYTRRGQSITSIVIIPWKDILIELEGQINELDNGSNK